MRPPKAANGIRAWAAAVVAVGLLMAGCTVFKEKRPPRPCPPVSILNDTATLTKFRPGRGRDLTDVVFQGAITKITGSCTYVGAKDGSNTTVSLEVALVFEARRGPADRDRRAAFDYFVGVTDSSQNVLNKNRFRVQVAFPANRSRLTISDEPVTLQIPLKADQDARGFQIFVGFQLSREELEYNRRRRVPVR